jgi:(1->4)-alpha-D-glucan 1-alpha-D-glucosylmutase
MATLLDFDVNLRATYRLQLHRDFGFAQASQIAPYLAELGVSHVYASPITTARAGSLHGYDVVDFASVNPELGGRAGLEAFVSRLNAHGLGLIIDIVPNHMAVGGADNPCWLDLLQKGRESAFADFFDVDFDAPGRGGKLLVPFLGKPYAQTLESGELALGQHVGRWALRYHDHVFPLRDRDQAEIASQGAEAFRSPERLHALLEAQTYRLAHWTCANDLINYRRFFEITTLAGVRIERPWVFDHVHRLPLELYAEGLVEGLRIDHIDGLTDPAGYADRLREALAERRPRTTKPSAYVVVEKILGGEEKLPAWPVFGTTGYDFMNEVSALQHEQAGAAPLGAFWAEISARPAEFEPEEREARRELIDINFCGQTEAVVDAMMRCASLLGQARDLARSAVRRGVRAVISHLRVYRSYALGGAGNPGAGEALEAAFAAARAEATPEPQAVALLEAVFADRSERTEFAEAIRRFHQLTAPAAAKAVEDTAFYRYGRLLSRNDVGFDAGRLCLPIEAFHARMRDRAENLPHAMLATATHDHKRGEDMRARLAVLSEIPALWIAHVRGWSELNQALIGDFAPADAYLLYQTIVGAWPFELAPDDAQGLAAFADRLAAWQTKALREAKLRSSWLAPNQSYENLAEEKLRALLDPGISARFLDSVSAFARSIFSAGAANALTQVALKCLAPGVPDFYQGCELWDLTLVDPDNRRPVDYETRARLLRSGGEAGAGAIKQDLIQTLLALRAEAPKLLAHGDYVPHDVRAPEGATVLAFSRRYGDQELFAALLLRAGKTLIGSDQLTPPAEFWGDGLLDAPGRDFEPVYGGVESGPQALLAEIFARSPVAVWSRGVSSSFTRNQAI